MRTSIYFNIFKTFVNHIWHETMIEHYATRAEFIGKMSVFPMNKFLDSTTQRKMIAL